MNPSTPQQKECQAAFAESSQAVIKACAWQREALREGDIESNGPKVVAQIEQPGPHRSFRRPTGRRQHLLVMRAPATTAEHKFKQTDLRRMKGDDDFLYHYSEGDDGRLGRINGPTRSV
ncbi:hypothetical protein [Rhodococcus sp. D-1]|uniref:hypothetical protein n=1 Tax=Rhodococcus sp. D-1 TaxID=1912238 RepID=UPI00117AB48D|nr:hypothetical protein [Rhodococcus sp. D-1]